MRQSIRLMDRSRRGLALIVVSGLLVLLAAAAAGMVGLSARMGSRVSIGIDRASARLLAWSGIQYGSARLYENPRPKAPPARENQSDDWTFRDDPDTPLEKAVNVSYAQTEPYEDTFPALGGAGGGTLKISGNGRYDPGLESFEDKNGDGRFDSWSGRLRSRWGAAGGTFALRVSGRNAEGAFNVNSGYLENTEVMGLFDSTVGKENGWTYVGDGDWSTGASKGGYTRGDRPNGVPDYADLGTKGDYTLVMDGIAIPSPTGMVWDAVSDQGPRGQQVRSILEPQVPAVGSPGGGGTVQENRTVDIPVHGWRFWDVLSQNRRVAFTINQLGLLLGLATAHPGDLVIQRRPMGGYRDVDELAGFFPAADWLRLKPYLAVEGRRNPNDFWGTNASSHYSPYAPRGTWDESPYGCRDHRYLLNVESADPIAVAAAFSGIGVLRYEGLMGGGMGLGVADLLTPPEALLVGGYLKRGFASRYDLYEKLRQDAGTLFLGVSAGPGEALSYTTVMGPPALRSPEEIQRSKARIVHAAAIPEEAANFRQAWFTPEIKRWAGFDAEGRIFKTHVTNQETSSLRGYELGLGPASLLTVESSGRVRDGSGKTRARASARGTVGQPWITAESQRQLEGGTGWDWFLTGGPGRPVRNRGEIVSSGTRVDVDGRAKGDRAATWPRLLPYAPTGPLSGLEGYWEEASGEVALLDWVSADVEAAFYVPVWDARQTARSASSPQNMSGFFQDARGGAVPRRYGEILVLSKDGKKEAVAADPFYGAGSALPGPSWQQIAAQYSWNRAFADKGYNNPGLPPWTDAKTGKADPITVAGWHAWPDNGFQNGTDWVLAHTSYSDVFFGPQSGAGQVLRAGFQGWSQWKDGSYSHSWHNPGPSAETDRRQYLAYTMGGGKVNGYVDGIWRGREDFDPIPWNPSWYASFAIAGEHDETSLFREEMTRYQLVPRAASGRFWSPDLGDIPSWLSPLYRFGSSVRLTSVRWDGFVPEPIRNAADQAGGTPLRVELLLYPDAAGEPVVIRLPEESWKTGGCRTDLEAFWRGQHGGTGPPPAASLRYRVWLDVSMCDVPHWTPFFDAIEIGFRGSRCTQCREGD